MNRKKQHNERNMWSFDVDDVGTANIVAGFLMAILSFRHKPLFTIIYFFFTIIHFGDSKVNSVTLVQNRLL